MRALGLGALVGRQGDLDGICVAESDGALDTLLIGEAANRISQLSGCSIDLPGSHIWPLKVVRTSG